MGRKPTNKFEESHFFDKDVMIRVFDIKVPFVYKFTVSPIGHTMWTEWEYHIPRSEDVPLVAREIESKGYRVTKIEPSVRKMLDLCPRCHRRGTPKIEKKDASDRRARRPTHLGEVERNEIHSKRLDEYWLVYVHSQNEKCRIRQYTNTPEPAYKKNDIEIEKYFFPMILNEMKMNSLEYS